MITKNNPLILAINPGSTTTKIAVFDNNKNIFQNSIAHSTEEIEKFEKIADQYEFRKNIILEELNNAGISSENIVIVIGRGGLIKPIKSGVYIVNEKMKEDLKEGILGQHASNLGGLIADDLAKALPNAKAYIADPVVVDELDDIARISGHPEFERISIFHALNQKIIAKTYAQSRIQKYEELNLIVAHIGGGISVGAHKKGKVIDVNQALDGEGPFSPERSGTLPVGALAKLCFSGKYTLNEIKKMITGKGGLTAYLGTNNAVEVEMKIRNGDKKAKIIYEAMAYQIAKEIGSAATVLKGKIDAILITGGIAYDETFVNWIKERVEFIAPVFAYPGEDEMRALAINALAVLKGELNVLDYK
ncbi:MAG: butyrate kinase [Bacteroidales bacterium]|nr:butyrate kinase [Bacteroidales bacterium]